MSWIPVFMNSAFHTAVGLFTLLLLWPFEKWHVIFSILQTIMLKNASDFGKLVEKPTASSKVMVLNL